MVIKNLRSKEDLKELVIGEWGYTDAGELPTGITLKADTKEKIIEGKLIAQWQGFHILYFKLNEEKKAANQTIDNFIRSVEREVISLVDKEGRRSKLFVCQDSTGNYWHFVNVLSTSQVNLRRFSIGPENRDRLRTASEQLSRLRIDTSDSLQTVISKHETAFDIEEVTNKFFAAFSQKFIELMDSISAVRKGADKKEIADLAQVILNRILFLKFIEKKGWLDGNKNYLYEKFQAYYSDEHSYWQEIMCPLFDLLSTEHTNPDKELGYIPFLNGGLFGKKPENLFTLNIVNEYFLSLFEGLLNRFNFTIEESSPSAVEVAVDPEMLGRIFEALILTIEKSDDLEQDLRRANGAYYTHRTVVFHMSRIVIAKSLSIKTDIDELKIRKLIDDSIDEIPDELQIKDCPINRQEAGNLLGEIEKLTICDPAVGSGAFLLVCMQILVGLRRFLNLFLKKPVEQDYNLKEKIIFENLVGVDILKQAVHICELRLWLSLVVDHKAEKAEEVPTLPNLSYKVFCGDSVVDHIQNKTSDAIEAFRKDFVKNRRLPTDASIRQNLERLKLLKKEHYHATNEKNKEEKMNQINRKKIEITLEMLRKDQQKIELEQMSLIDKPKQEKIDLTETIREMEKNQIQELIAYLDNVRKHGSDVSYVEKMNFVWLLDLVEYFIDHGNSGFDIVIGNPPYGLKNESMIQGKERYLLESKDSFGVFIALSVLELLKDNGILSLITSDTWQTIKSHKVLRRILLENTKVHEILMMPSWIFGATVNTSIFVATKVNKGAPLMGKDNAYQKTSEIRHNEIFACDFTRADKKSGQLEEYLYSIDSTTFFSSKDVAFYKYSQGLIETNSNLPFFVGSPKLFALLHDTTNKTIEKEIGEKDRKKVKVRQIELNGQIVELVRLGDIAEVKVGLQTGDNDYYLFQNPDARGSYKNIEEYKEFLLTKKDLEQITNNEELRLKVISKGFHKSRNEEDFDKDLWFEGKYIVPYDKGGESDTDSGWLPNYYVPTNYYIDWSSEAIKRMKTHTIAQRIRDNNENKIILSHYETQKAAVFRNTDTYFEMSIGFSDTGVYAPTFRLNSGTVYDVMSMSIFIENSGLEEKLTVLSSKLIKYLIKNYINHTVHTQVEGLKPVPYIIQKSNTIKRLGDMVWEIINKQKQNPHYDYMRHEQKGIDKLVYKIYGLNKEDIQEVEKWYARRYPKLEKYCDIED